MGRKGCLPLTPCGVLNETVIKGASKCQFLLWTFLFQIHSVLFFFSVTLTVTKSSSWFFLGELRDEFYICRPSEEELEELMVSAENCLLKHTKTRRNSLAVLEQNPLLKKRN